MFIRTNNKDDQIRVIPRVSRIGFLTTCFCHFSPRSTSERHQEPAQILRIDPDDVYTSSSDDYDSDDEILYSSSSRDVINGVAADDVINDDLAEAEEEFRLEMTRSKMMLRDYEDDDDVTEDGATTSPPATSGLFAFCLAQSL